MKYNSGKGRKRFDLNGGETAWIKYTWDGKYDKVDEEQLVQELVQGKRKKKRTNLYRG